jgi:hypothetical protein
VVSINKKTNKKCGRTGYAHPLVVVVVQGTPRVVVSKPDKKEGSLFTSKPIGFRFVSKPDKRRGGGIAPSLVSAFDRFREVAPSPFTLKPVKTDVELFPCQEVKT